MATSSFKRKTYGMVKPIKIRKVKVKRPDVRELARYYKAVASQGMWSSIDNMCYAMKWWEDTLTWFKASRELEDITTAQARKIAIALLKRKNGINALTDAVKIQYYYESILQGFEGLAKLAGLKVPEFQKYVDAGEKVAAKHKVILEKMEPKFARITGLLTDMFPSFTMDIVPVPRIVDPVTGKDVGRKIDHTKNAIYYSRVKLQEITKQLRHQGYLAVAIEEAWWLARAAEMPLPIKGEMQIVNTRHHLARYEKLLWGFEVWARRKDTPSRLAKKPAKPKKPTKKERELAEMGEAVARMQDDADHFDKLDADETVIQ